MWARGIISLTVVALWACVAAAQQPASLIAQSISVMGAAEPNDPNQAWDPAKHLTAAWQSMSVNLASTIYNPVTKPNQKPKVAQRSLSMSTQVNITDANGLLGFCWSTATGVQTLDENGKVICNKTNNNQNGRFYWPPTYIKMMSTAGVWVSELQPYTFSVDLSPDPNTPYPSLLNQVNWSMYALVTDTLTTVDVPFKVSDQWVELAPNLEIRVDKASATGSSFDYSLSVKYNSTEAAFSTIGATFLMPGQKPAAGDRHEDRRAGCPGQIDSGPSQQRRLWQRGRCEWRRQPDERHRDRHRQLQYLRHRRDDSLHTGPQFL